MADYRNNSDVCRLVDLLKTSKEELEVLLEEHDEGTLTDYSQFLCLVEDMSEYASQLDKKTDELDAADAPGDDEEDEQDENDP